MIFPCVFSTVDLGLIITSLTRDQQKDSGNKTDEPNDRGNKMMVSRCDV